MFDPKRFNYRSQVNLLYCPYIHDIGIVSDSDEKTPLFYLPHVWPPLDFCAPFCEFYFRETTKNYPSPTGLQVLSSLTIFGMASAKVREELCCSLCLDIYSDPVCLSCGHHFCKNCIENLFRRQKESRVYTCPECRTTFKKKPELTRSRKLCNIVEHLFSDQTKQDGVILCTYCIGFNTHAVKRCLLCEAFLCEEHLKVHSKSQEHALTETNSSVLLESDRKCLTHKELLKFYCYQDNVFLCPSCFSDEKHAAHQVDTLSHLCKHKMDELKHVLDKTLLTRRYVDKQVHELKGQVKQVQEKANELKVRTVNLFVDIRKQVDELENLVLDEISRQKDDIEEQVSAKIQDLEILKDELYQKILHIEELFGVSDAVSFLKECKVVLDNNFDFENNQKVKYMGTGTFTHKLDDALISVTLQSSMNSLVHSLAKLKAKRDFQLEANFNIVMDCNTANSKVALSQDLRAASYLKTDTKQSTVLERFASSQVLSTTGFTSGEHYLEVQVSTTGYWVVGMAYPTIKKAGNESLIGCNEKSWGLVMLNNNLSALHNSDSKSIRIDRPLRALAIYLNYEAGQLSFYKLSHPIRHLHTFKTTFTEALYPAFYVCGNSWVRLCS
ncbi:E3 ubiquitin-protein ligase TRIM39-like [Dendropsophus ebraccatus]|uniref:E3 ubiquitin-protein ligase TRIM39-like n=1 Tax=Dendropsophus ebraccatus TaxID=150705 RepID=UPI0038310564